jgi:ribosomal protein L24E
MVESQYETSEKAQNELRDLLDEYYDIMRKVEDKVEHDHDALLREDCSCGSTPTPSHDPSMDRVPLYPNVFRHMTPSNDETPNYSRTPGGSSSSEGSANPSSTRTSVVPLRRNPLKTSWTHTVVEPVMPAMREEPPFTGRAPIQDPSTSEQTSVKTSVLERRFGKTIVLGSEFSNTPRVLPNLMSQFTAKYDETPNCCGTPGGSSLSKGGTSPSCTRTSVAPLRRNPFKMSWTHTVVEPVVPAMPEEPRFGGRDSFINLRFTKSNPFSKRHT